MYPKATDYIGKMEKMITRLLNDGFAYERDGSIYFRKTSFRAYGLLLSKKQRETLMKTEHTVGDGNVVENKDFVLWKGYDQKNPLHSTVYWKSAFGVGRPGIFELFFSYLGFTSGFIGWHIECSAMSHALLGDSIDIHGGGIDLLFPHHCNEIAQSEAYTGII